MIAFEALVNGERKCLASIGNDGVLDASLVWSGRGRQTEVEGQPVPRPLPRIHMSGLVGDARGNWENDEHVDWFTCSHPLNVGDEVALRVSEIGSLVEVDAPAKRHRRKTCAEMISEPLAAALALLPSPCVESSPTTLQNYHALVSRHDFLGALDTLGALGELNVVPVNFWKTLVLTAHFMQLESECDRYKKKAQEQSQYLNPRSSERLDEVSRLNRGQQGNTMIAYEVLVNGERQCLASIGDDGVLTAGLTWVGNEKKREAAEEPRLPHLQVGGLAGEEHQRWLSPRLDIKVGDEVLIRVVEVGSLDEVDALVERSLSQTRAEKETEARTMLAAVVSLLPLPCVEIQTVSLQTYHQHIARNFLTGALDTLASLGKINPVSVEYWRKLAKVAHHMSLYEDRNRYYQKAQDQSSSPPAP